jgi:CHU_C Type IX secretion signal domain
MRLLWIWLTLIMAIGFLFSGIVAAQSPQKMCLDSIQVLYARDFGCPFGATAQFSIPSGATWQTQGADALRIQFQQTGDFELVCACGGGAKKLKVLVTDCGAPSCLGPNLVPNPGFERYQRCDSVPSLQGAIPGWSDLTLTTGPLTGSVDYFNATCTKNNPLGLYRQIPLDNPPRTGEGMIGGFQFRFQAYTVIWDTTGRLRKEYAYAKLNKPLQVGKKYRLRFYAKYAISRQFRNGSVDRLGAVLSVKDPRLLFDAQRKPSAYLGPEPLLESPAGQQLNDSVFWVPISREIIADQSYEYVLLGHFHGLDETSIRNFFQGTNSYNAYCLFDDVSLEEILEEKPYTAVQIERVCRHEDTATIVRRLGCDSLITIHRVFSSYLDTTFVSEWSEFPRDTGRFILNLKSRNGCDSVLKKSVFLRPNSFESLPCFVPNVFSPNNDGINDQFCIHSNPSMSLLGYRGRLFALYDRWGGLQIEKKDFPLEEHVCLSGQHLLNGLYAWVLILERPDGKVYKKHGQVQVLR